MKPSPPRRQSPTDSSLFTAIVALPLPKSPPRGQDGVQKPKPGEIANFLHIDMIAHRKKTADFNEGWKVRLRAERDAERNDRGFVMLVVWDTRLTGP